jgi:hypothetical protein
MKIAMHIALKYDYSFFADRVQRVTATAGSAATGFDSRVVPTTVDRGEQR